MEDNPNILIGYLLLSGATMYLKGAKDVYHGTALGNLLAVSNDHPGYLFFIRKPYISTRHHFSNIIGLLPDELKDEAQGVVCSWVLEGGILDDK